MLRISIIETRFHRKLVLEGKLIEPWLGELRQVWSDVKEDTRGRKPVIDLSNVTVISQEGEAMLLELMQQGAKFSCGGVLTRHVLKQLARLCQAESRNVLHPKKSRY
jgi:hypothetical protein